MPPSYFICPVVVFLLLWVTPGCAAQGWERLHVNRLANGYVAITAEQQVREWLLFLAQMLRIRLDNRCKFTFCRYQVALSYAGDRPTFFDQFPRPLAQVALNFASVGGVLLNGDAGDGSISSGGAAGFIG
jgi:hypothetical protein